MDATANYSKRDFKSGLTKLIFKPTKEDDGTTERDGIMCVRGTYSFVFVPWTPKLAMTVPC